MSCAQEDSCLKEEEHNPLLTLPFLEHSKVNLLEPTTPELIGQVYGGLLKCLQRTNQEQSSLKHQIDGLGAPS